MHTWIQQIGHRRTRSHQEELVKRHHGKEALGEEMQARRRRFVACSVSGYGSNSVQCPSIFRFPELVKRMDNPGPAHTTAKLFGEQHRSNWPVGYEFDLLERDGIDATSRSSLENADKCSTRVLRKSPIPTPHRSVRTSKALTVIWILSPCLFLLSLAVTMHTLDNSVIISPSFKSVTNAMKVGMFRLRCSFVTRVARNATTPFVITRREEGASSLARNANSKLLRVW